MVHTKLTKPHLWKFVQKESAYAFIANSFPSWRNSGHAKETPAQAASMCNHTLSSSETVFTSKDDLRKGRRSKWLGRTDGTDLLDVIVRSGGGGSYHTN